MNLILASTSPRRHALLSEAGFIFTIHAADIDESQRAGELPKPFALRLAKEKAGAVAAHYQNPADVILAADTIVCCDDKIFGKPKNQEQARDMLTALSGRAHEVITAYCILTPTKQRVICDTETTVVHFRTLTDVEITAYVATGEPMDKAGAYAIQGGAKNFVKKTIGSLTNVIGLPMERITALLFTP